MKKVLMGLLIFLFLASCATTRPKVEHKYSNITPDKMQDTCDTDNRWWMQVAGVSVVVMQFDNCLGVDNILVMITPTKKYTAEIRSYSYKLLGLHYVEFLNHTKTDKLWSIEQIREFDVLNLSGDETSWMVIYKINSKPAVCSGETCKKKQ